MKAKFKTGLSIAVMASFVAPMIAPVWAVAATEGSAVRATDKAGQLALDQSTLTMLSLVMAVSKVEQNAGGLVAVDEQIAKKYQMIRMAYGFSVPTTGVGVVASGLGAESVRKVEFVLAPLTALLRSSQKLGVMALNGVEAFSRATGLDKVLDASVEASSRTVEASYNILKSMLASLINEHTMLSSGTSSASAIAGGSSFLLLNDSKKVMTKDTVRAVLGQDKIVRSRVDAAVAGLSEIYTLDASQQARLQVAIYDDVIRQAVENDFSADLTRYKLDIMDLMVKKQILDKSEIDAIAKIRSVAVKLTRTSQATEDIRQLAIDNVDLALQLAALLESQLQGDKLKDPAMRSEVERMLGSVVAKLSLVGFNLNR